MSIFSRFSIFVILTITIIGCAESDKTTQAPSILIEKLEFPYINDNTLFEFIPATGESKAVEAIFPSESQEEVARFRGEAVFDDTTTMYVHSPEGHIVYLDTDQSVEAKDDESRSALRHTLLAEFVAFTSGSALYLFEINTRHTFPIKNFTNEDGSATQICLLRPSISLDEESRLVSQILYKNETKLFVKTAAEDCSTGPYEYYQVDLEQDEDTEYEIRRNILEKHVHASTHYHVHDDTHNHEHEYEEGELDENGLPFDPNNHLHFHEHEHDLNYGELDEHLFLSKEEIDEVHNSTKYLKTVFEYNEIWVGRATKTREAIANAGHPVFDSTTNEFGYLGYNSQENQFEFYVNYENSNFKNLEYTFDLDELGIAPLSEPLVGDHSETPWFDYFDDAILYRHNDNLIRLPIRAVFDDDQRAVRENRYEEPLYTIQNPDDFEILYSSTSGTLYMKDGVDILKTTKELQEFTTDLMASFPTDEAPNFKAYATSSSVLVRKFFNQDGSQSNFDLSSAVKLSGQTLIEDTVLPVSESYIKIQNGSNDNVLVHGELFQEEQLRAQIYNNALIPSYNAFYDNSIWGRITNMFSDEGEPLEQAIINSEDTILLDVGGHSIPALLNASVYTYDNSQLKGHGTLLGTIPGNLAEVISIDVRSDYFGEIKIKDSFEADSATKTYFFPTSLSFINPTGSFGDMKLMYDNAIADSEANEENEQEVNQDQENNDEELSDNAQEEDSGDTNELEDGNDTQESSEITGESEENTIDEINDLP